MRIFDPKFRDNKLRYVGQTFMGAIGVTAALLIFDVVNQPVIIASLGASGFTAFAAPHRRVAGPRHLIGGYIIGIAVGCALHYLADIPVNTYMEQKALHLLACAIAFSLAMFLMAITSTEHAPAAAIAIGFVLNIWTVHTVILVMAGIIVIAIMQRIMKPWMMDLV